MWLQFFQVWISPHPPTKKMYVLLVGLKNHEISSHWWWLEIQKNPASYRFKTLFFGGSNRWFLEPGYSLWPFLQEISNRTYWTDPEKTWVSNSLIATYLGGSVGKVPFDFWWIFEMVKRDPFKLLGDLQLARGWSLVTNGITGLLYTKSYWLFNSDPYNGL